jgi:hypothetical protein
MTTASLSTPTGAISASDTGLDVVTGAFSYSGRAIAAALSDAGRRVRTLTGHPGRAPEGSPLEVRPLDFVDQLGLVESLSGVTTRPSGPRCSESCTSASRIRARAPLAVFQRKGGGRACPGRSRRSLCGPSPGRPFWRRRRPLQQHRLAVTPRSRLCGGRARGLPDPGDPHRRSGPTQRGQREGVRRQRDRRRWA